MIRHLRAEIDLLRASDESLRRDCATNLRRCAELQADLDRIIKLLKAT
jgi:hypothetical protein